MHPLLFQIGPVPIHSYGTLIALGFLGALGVLRWLAPSQGILFADATDLAFACLFSGFLGARILFVLTLLKDFLADPAAVFRVWEGGLVFYGGPLAALPVLIWIVRKRKLDFWKVGDLFAPALTIAHFFGRLGCFAAGCCFGKPTDAPWGVRFGSGAPLHPTQLYEAFSLLVLFFGLCYTIKRKRFDGQVMLLYLMAYPVIRSIVEIFRGDVIRGFVIEDLISTSQFISFIVFISAFAVLLLRLRAVRAEATA